MRIPAKALPCLLFCVACVTVLPAQASARAASTPYPALATPLEAQAHATRTPDLAHRLRDAEGTQVARRRTKTHHAAPKVASAAPRDTSNRFLMTQNGKQMTADDFEAWMKSRGIRVAKGAPPAGSATN